MAGFASFFRFIGLGNARKGTRHWRMQRVSAVALIPLSIIFALTFGSALGSGHEAVLSTYSNSFNALAAILFLGVGLFHLQQGLQVVLEDYVHGRLGSALHLLNTILCVCLGAAGTYSIAQIWLTHSWGN
ncbi:MAG: succinate dehydrogenase, hydrophobic membrane anchor protein [Albidovulum sp.]|nr:succinate dehydrogenase, hydrophobic membrane anchor protein [Albidovulum sp.]MDE0533938.1 succinate dehydrogenase, hydrophobic membrane anchor protein [Albidovulum sp.]